MTLFNNRHILINSILILYNCKSKITLCQGFSRLNQLYIIFVPYLLIYKKSCKIYIIHSFFDYSSTNAVKASRIVLTGTISIFTLTSFDNDL